MGTLIYATPGLYTGRAYGGGGGVFCPGQGLTNKSRVCIKDRLLGAGPFRAALFYTKYVLCPKVHKHAFICVTEYRRENSLLQYKRNNMKLKIGHTFWKWETRFPPNEWL